MPSAVHNVPFQVLSPPIQCFLDKLPGKGSHIFPAIEMAGDLLGGETSAVPDFMISIGAHSTREKVIPVIGETAFSQSTSSLLKKLDRVVRSNPDIVMVIMVKIDERTRYETPRPNSNAWHTLRQAAKHTLGSYISAQATTVTTGQPIVVAGHTWCHLKSVEFTVWVSDGHNPIDINITDNQAICAHGVSS
jgi:hypothetical protein